MTDLWIDVILTILVTFATVIADWLANLLVTSTRGLAKVNKVLEEASNSKAKIDAIQKEIDKYQTTKSINVVWGSELAAIALSMDLSILGIWVSNPQFFPFFAKWNSTTTSRELPVWLILIFLHFVVLLISISLKHRHIDLIESIGKDGIAGTLGRKWFAQYKFMLSSNAIGFLSLLLSMIAITNAI